MALGELHLTERGPEPCRADPSQPRARGCPFSAGGHYATAAEAEAAFAELQGGTLAPAVSRDRGTVELKLDFGSVEVPAGELSDPQVRFHFANGLCGDLANAVRELDGERKLYFSLDTDREGKPGKEELEQLGSLDELTRFVFHAVVESSHQPGMFLDAYGVQSREAIEGFFGGPLVEAPPGIFAQFHTGESHDLRSFAEELLRMDAAGISYSYRDYGDTLS